MLDKGERAVLSSFRSREAAEGAARKIRSLGLQDLSINSFSTLAMDYGYGNNYPISGNITSLAGLVEDADLSSHDDGILLAADPVNSGMTDGEGVVTGYNWGLTVVSPDALVDRVVAIIKAAGGFT